MPTCNRFAVPLTFKQFLSAVLLRIFSIQNLEPSAVLSLRHVGCRFLLGNDALQIQFANTFKQGSARSTCSAYRKGNGGEIFASNRRSSCLRSINRSVRKSLPSRVNKSNAKKHGGSPR